MAGEAFWNVAAFVVGAHIMCMTLAAVAVVALVATEIVLRAFGSSLGIDLGELLSGNGAGSYPQP